MKYTRTAFTGSPIASVLDNLVDAANLKDLPFHNGDVHARRHSADHPDQIRITITVERVSPTRKPRHKLNTMGYDVNKPAPAL